MASLLMLITSRACFTHNVIYMLSSSIWRVKKGLEIHTNLAHENKTKDERVNMDL